MATMYMTGYEGKTRTREELLAWSVWQRIDPEFARRLLMLMDAAIADGQQIGIGGGWRSSEQQLTGFLDRFHPEDDTNLTGDTYFPYRLPSPRYGKPVGTLVEYWEKDAGDAPMAPPLRSYHESTTKAGKCLAVDMVGNTKWYTDRCSRFGLVHFGNVNGELWHLQPAEIPHSRKNYNPAIHEPLKVFGIGTITPVPVPPKPAVPFVIVPQPVQRLQTPLLGNLHVAQLQQVLVFWGWMPEKTVGGKTSIDGWFGPMMDLGVRKMQEALKVKVDGVYGKQTASAYRAFAEGMAKFASGK